MTGAGIGRGGFAGGVDVVGRGGGAGFGDGDGRGGESAVLHHARERGGERAGAVAGRRGADIDLRAVGAGPPDGPDVFGMIDVGIAVALIIVRVEGMVGEV